MPKIILRCNYLKNAPPSHLANYMNYISTREGVEKVDSTSALLYWCRIRDCEKKSVNKILL